MAGTTYGWELTQKDMLALALKKQGVSSTETTIAYVWVKEIQVQVESTLLI